MRGKFSGFAPEAALTHFRIYTIRYVVLSRGIGMRRRDFHLFLIGATAMGSVATHSQERIRRVAVLTVSAVGEPATQARFAALKQALQQLGWIDRDNLLIDYRAASGSADVLRQHVNELASLRPEVIVAIGSEAVTLVQQAS